MGYRLLADATVVVHFAFLAYVLVGGWIAVRFRWSILTHLAAAGWALAIVVVPGLDCPLTWVQDWALRRSGEGPVPGGFIDTYVRGVLYPDGWVVAAQVVVAVVVLSSWLVYGYTARRRAT